MRILFILAVLCYGLFFPVAVQAGTYIQLNSGLVCANSKDMQSVVQAMAVDQKSADTVAIAFVKVGKCGLIASPTMVQVRELISINDTVYGKMYMFRVVRNNVSAYMVASQYPGQLSEI